MAELQYTPLDAIRASAQEVRENFAIQKTKPLEWRLRQLRKLYWGLKDNAAAILEACNKDLGKGEFETGLTELDWCTNDCIYVNNNLRAWAKDEAVPDIPLMHKAISPKIRKEPLGAVLIIGPYNYPVQLVICPLIGAIAAGNTVVVKPSENASHVATVLQKIIETSLDPTCFKCVQGAIAETTALLEEKWDKIFFTGGATVAKIISKKAAETLTPVTLELGGKNPAIVTKNADIRLAARRLLWGKTFNAGQTCISHNYVLIDKTVVEAYIKETKTAMQEYFPKGTRETSDYGRIINHRQWSRMKKMLDDTQGKIVFGGETDEKDFYFAPTMVQVNSATDSLMAEESFGPLMTVLPFESLDQAIRIANQVHATPLGLYPFGNQQETDRCLQEIRSGGATVNDTYYHGSLHNFAFGGVGDSGQGAYRGKASFDCFSHRRSIAKTPGWVETFLKIRYPPYDGKLAKLRMTSELKPNFDREGKATFGMGSMIGLGASSKGD